MSEVLNQKESLLNFSFLSAVFFNYVVKSGNISEKLSLQPKKSKYSKKEQPVPDVGQIQKIIEEINFEKEFEKLNDENLMNYFNNLSYLDKSDEKIKNFKLNFIKSVLGFNLDENEKKKKKYFLY